MSTAQSPNVRLGAIRWIVRETLGNLILIAILFGIVGRWDWWPGWALSVIYILWSFGSAALILPVNPAMLAERARPVSKDTPRWDIAFLTVFGLATLALYIVACLDVRWNNPTPFPFAVQVLAFIIGLLGYAGLLVWSMAANAFFVATVRIQTDRDQKVVSTGPYAIVRHPGYLGTILTHAATPFLLNSAWAIIPALVAVLTLVVRTHFEDRYLQANLPGYTDYAARVRHRLIPAVW